MSEWTRFKFRADLCIKLNVRRPHLVRAPVHAGGFFLPGWWYSLALSRRIPR
jgi:hypothetical protein